jgi:fluoride exporter
MGITVNNKNYQREIRVVWLDFPAGQPRPVPDSLHARRVAPVGG